MENASKALLMAAGTLVGLLILSLAVYLFISFGSSAAEIEKENAATQLENFNVQFTSYDGRSNLTIYDVVSIINLAKNNNEYNDATYDSSNPQNSMYILVTFPGETNVFTCDTNKLIKDNSAVNADAEITNKFTCKCNISSITGRVYKIDFTRS